MTDTTREAFEEWFGNTPAGTMIKIDALNSFQAGIAHAMKMLESEKMVELVARTINELANKEYNFYYMGKNDSLHFSQAALSAITQKLKGE